MSANESRPEAADDDLAGGLIETNSRAIKRALTRKWRRR